MDVAASIVLTLALAGTWAMLRFDPLRRNPTAGRHRPETVHVVGALYGLKRPALYQRYQYFINRYGRGVWQAQEWADRARRRAVVEASRAARAALADYRWLALYETTGEYRMVSELVGAR